ncbi:hypothetical protein MMC14_000102 [Varicellaria rhodocarpa]|nr:hypothetical protein [Varicellaria rhodocarpa]
MSPVAQSIDALWHCFCPRFYAINAPSITATTRRIFPAIVSRPRRQRSRRQYHETRCVKSATQYNLSHHHHDVANDVADDISSQNGSAKFKSVLYEELRKASNKGEMLRVRQLARSLVEEGAEAPNSLLYTALLLANTDPEYGSPVEAERLLHEMEAIGIPPGSTHYHAVLKVLSIHPDYLFRNEILDKLQQQWFSLTNDGWHDVIVGLLRERQIEMAIDSLDRMQEEGSKVQPWLLDLMVYTLCNIGEFSQVMTIMRERFNQGELEISGTLWAYILDTASRALHHELTHYAWTKQVASEYLNPSSGVCINVLNTAARCGDYRLSTDVFRVLGKRSSALKLYHYEALLESYVKASDLRTALTILTIMLTAGIQPEEGTTRAIYFYLRESSLKTHEALSVLRELHDGQRQIPTVAVNCIIEALVQQNDVACAMETYQTLYTLCPAGPTTATFNALLRGCAHSSRKDLAMFLASEMLTQKVVPNALTYDRLILVCIVGKGDNDIDDAFRYFGEMKGMGWWPRRGTVTMMVKRTCEAGDERVFDLLDEMEKKGVDIVGLQRWVGEKWEDGVSARKTREIWKDRDGRQVES